MYNERVGQIAAVIVFVGFNVTFFVQFIAGAKGMPRRYASYPEEFTSYHRVSTIGAYILGLGLFTVAYNWIDALRHGKKAPANPWGANTLEWHCASPPPHDNFAVAPEVDDPYHLGGWEYDPKIEGWVQRHEPNESAPAPGARPVTH
jgi:cytochrome c oxidase subunit 1